MKQNKHVYYLESKSMSRYFFRKIGSHG
jgi:hypothetical protein